MAGARDLTDAEVRQLKETAAAVEPAADGTGEVIDKEWDMLGNLVVTYFKGPSSRRAECTAFNSQNKPIGSGSS